MANPQLPTPHRSDFIEVCMKFPVSSTEKQVPVLVPTSSTLEYQSTVTGESETVDLVLYFTLLIFHKTDKIISRYFVSRFLHNFLSSFFTSLHLSKFVLVFHFFSCVNN